MAMNRNNKTSTGDGAAEERGTSYTTTRIPARIAKELRVWSVRHDISMTEIMETAVRRYCADEGIPLPDDEQEKPASRIA